MVDRTTKCGVQLILALAAVMQRIARPGLSKLFVRLNRQPTRLLALGYRLPSAEVLPEPEFDPACSATGLKKETMNHALGQSIVEE